MEHLSLFEAYVLEREDAILLKHEHGFAIYKNIGDVGYLQDVFVRKQHRQQGIGQQFVAQALTLAKKSNKSALITSVDTATNGATQSATAILKSGFKILNTEGSVIWFTMPVKG